MNAAVSLSWGEAGVADGGGGTGEAVVRDGHLGLKPESP